jgi:hypothetical protein
MASRRDVALELADRWDREAFGYERDARTGDYTPTERRLLEMHARVKRGCASELRIEMRKISNA